MKYVLTVYLLLTLSAIFSQRSYLDRLYQLSSSFPDGFTEFIDFKVVDDSVTVIGEINDSNYSFQQNLFVARFDTLGQLASLKFLTEDDDSIPMITNMHTRLYYKDSLFYVLGEPFDDWSTLRLFILDKNLNLLKSVRHKMIEDSQYIVWSRTAIALDGYIYICLNAYKDYSELHEPSIIKLDKYGNIVWRKIYPAENASFFPIKFYNLSENEISFISNTYNNTTKEYLTQITCIDTSGAIINEIYPKDTDRGYAMDSLPNGDLLILGGWFDIYDYNTTVPQILRIDSTGKTIWHLKFDEGPQNIGYFYELENNKDGTYTVVGKSRGNGNALKVTVDGEVLWRHSYPVDSIIPQTSYYRTLTSVERLSGGNLMACGIFNGYTPSSPRKDYGWLVKIWPDGCIDELCETGTETMLSKTYVEHLSKEKPYVWPNPASEEAHMAIPAVLRSGTIDLYGIDGGLILRQAIVPDINTLSPLDHVKGLTVYVIRDEQGQIRYSGKILWHKD